MALPRRYSDLALKPPPWHEVRRRFGAYPWLAEIRRRLQLVLGIDVRSLAALRMGLGLFMLYDLVSRAVDLRAHYTDFGILPRAVLLNEFGNPNLFSFHLATGAASGQALLFLISFAFALALLVGYRTRVVSVVSWLMLVSLQNRNFAILQGGDVLFRLLAFWAMFLPLGAVWSVDSRKKGSPPRSAYQYFSMGSASLLLQVGMVYVFAAILKNSVEWRVTYTAVHNALYIDQLVTPLGVWMRDYPGLCKFFTVFTLYFEAYGALLLFCPLFFNQVRSVGVVLFVSLHAGFSLFLLLGHFPFVALVAFSAFIPGAAWDALQRRWGILPSPVVALKPSRPRLRMSDIAAFGALALAAGWNLSTMPGRKYPMPQPMVRLSEILRLDQEWNMFAPKPLTEDGWYVMSGELRDGTKVDVLRHKEVEVSWAKPKRVSDLYVNERWRKYLMNLWARTYSGHRLHYARYLCRSWNEDRSFMKQLLRFQIHFMLEMTLDGGREESPRSNLLWSHECFGS